MKKSIYVLFLISSMFMLNACHSVTPDADEEAVLIKKPWFFGWLCGEGVDEEPVTTGCTWCVCTTTSETFKITPQRYDEKFDDIFSNDNTPLDFDTYINIQIERGKTPILLKNYGTGWYRNNIQVFYRNKTREYVSMYNPFDLISNREVLNKIDSALIVDVRNHVASLSKDKELPIKIISITTGAAKPNKEQLGEMNKTAQYIQQKRSMEQKAIAEVARADAETKRARADKAYMEEMKLNTDQYIMLKLIEKGNPNIDVMIGSGTTSMWNVRR